MKKTLVLFGILLSFLICSGFAVDTYDVPPGAPAPIQSCTYVYKVIYSGEQFPDLSGETLANGFPSKTFENLNPQEVNSLFTSKKFVAQLKNQLEKIAGKPAEGFTVNDYEVVKITDPEEVQEMIRQR